MQIEIFDHRRCTLGEGPTSSGGSNSQVMWVDIIGKKILTKDILTGQTTEESTEEEVGFALPGEESGVVVGYASGAKFVTASGTSIDLPSWREISPDSETTPVRWNDAKVSPYQQLFAGTMAFDATPGAGGLYLIDSSGRQIQELIPNVSISNGLDWSPAKDKFYYIDTLTFSVVEYDYNQQGIANPRILISFDKGDVLPDGMCVDAEGGLWVAFWNGGCINRYDSHGKISGSYPLPVKNVTSCAFGGPNLDILIITTAALTDEDNPDSGKTFMAKPGVQGQPFNLYPLPSR